MPIAALNLCLLIMVATVDTVAGTGIIAAKAASTGADLLSGLGDLASFLTSEALLATYPALLVLWLEGRSKKQSTITSRCILKRTFWSKA